MNQRILPFLLLAAVVLYAAPGFAAQEYALQTKPGEIEIGAGYNGKYVTVTGDIPAGSSAVVRILGERESKQFKKKGQAFGFLWMNLENITLRDVPDVFLLASDRSLYAGGGYEWTKLGLGFGALRGEADDFTFGEFLKLKEQEKLYSIQEGGFEYAPSADGPRMFKVTMAIPSSLRQGIYKVEAFGVKDGRVVSRASVDMEAKLTGFPALLGDMAFHHSLLYGIFAVVVAILAGLLMTAVFRDKGGAH
jgi:hypothetical protein